MHSFDDQSRIGINEELDNETGEGIELVEGDGKDKILYTKKLNFVASISSLQLVPNDLSHMKLPLCYLVPLPMVRPTLGL